MAPGRVAGELAGLEPLGDARKDVVPHELPDGVPDRAFLVGEKVVDLEEVEGVDLGPGHGGA